MACYDFDYAVRSLRQSIDFAEIEHDFVPLRKWANETERSGHDLGVTDARFNSPSGQYFLVVTLQSVESGELAAEEALRRIRDWLNGNPLSFDMEVKGQCQRV